jgi:O-methyltransferase
MLQLIPNLLRSKEDRAFRAIYRRFQAFTMIPEPHYLANLELTAAYRHVAGDIVECGTWKGGMIAGMAQILGPDRRYHLFDSFTGLPPATAIDGKAALNWQRDTASKYYFNNCTAEESSAISAIQLAGATNFRTVKGWFADTLRRTDLPPKIAILRLDSDWYASTMQVLEALFERVVDRGLIIVDDYYAWDGCSKATHDYLSSRQATERIRSHKGVCYLERRRREAEAITENLVSGLHN